MKIGSVQWEKPEPQENLTPDALHVWRVGLDQPGHVIRRLSDMLSGDEKERAEKYYYALDGKRFIVGRGTLREILGSYLGCDSAEVSFVYGPYGKPSILNDVGGIEFSVAHSNEMALFTIAKGRRTGVDVEHYPRPSALTNLPHDCFSCEEHAFLRRQPLESKAESFLCLWTLKEAYQKAVGMGHFLPFHRFSVSIFDGENPTIATREGDPAARSEWSLKVFSPAFEYIASIAVEGNHNDTRYLTYR